MDILTSVALLGVRSAFSALLPDDLRPTLIVVPTRVTPTGLGGYVGHNAEPAGDIVGRRLEATALVTVRAAGDNQLSGAVNAALGAVLAADRASLIGQGILHMALEEVGPEEPGKATVPHARRAGGLSAETASREDSGAQ